MINRSLHRFTAKLLVFVLATNPLLLAAHGAERALSTEPVRLAPDDAELMFKQYQQQVSTQGVNSTPTGTHIQLAEDQQAGLKLSADGVTVVDIAAPTQGGVSHNQFSHFGVPAQGVIFNNSDDPYVSVLGGWTDGNRRLTGGTAGLILAEVTGANRSHLLGITEVLGDSAEFVIANPNGITCNGCGFLNTPRVVMTTGLPEFFNGKLSSFDVAGGDIRFDGDGLNASNVSKFDILARAVEINAVLQANELSIYTGINSYELDSDTITPQTTPNAATPDYQFSLDISELGGMYANNIRLIGTEAGLGIRNAGLIKSANDLTLTADGRLELKHTIAENQMVIESHSDDIAINGTTFAKQTEIKTNKILENIGLVAASDKLTVHAKEITQRGDLIAGINEKGEWLETAQQSIDVGGTLDNEGRIISQGGQTIQMKTLNNDTAGLIQGGNTQLAAQDGMNSGTLLSDTLDLSASSLSNAGNIQAGTLSLRVNDFGQTAGGIYQTDDAGSLQINTDNFQLNDGVVFSAGAAALTSEHLFNAGKLQLADNSKLMTSNLTNQGTIISADNTSLVTDRLANDENAIIQVGVNATIDAAVSLENQGAISISGDAKITSESINNDYGSIQHLNGGPLQITATDLLSNHQGEISSVGTLTIQAPVLTNIDGQLSATNLSLDSAVFTNSAGIISGDDVTISATSVNNVSGSIGAQSMLSVISSERIDNTDGLLSSNDTAFIKSPLLINQGEINANDALTLNVDNLENKAGSLINASTLTIDAETINNASNANIEADFLNLSAPSLTNNGLLLISGQADDALSLHSDQVTNTGIIENHSENFSLENVALTNDQGEIYHYGNGVFDLTSAGTINNTNGLILSNGILRITGNAIENQTGKIQASQAIQLNASFVDNSDGQLVADTDITIASDDFDNTRGLVQAASLLDIASGDLINHAGELFVLSDNAQKLSVNVRGVLDNTDGNIYSQAAQNDVRSSIMVNVQGSASFTSNTDISTDTLTNTDGIIVSEAALTIGASHIDTSGRIAAQSMAVNAQQITNTGQLHALNSVTITGEQVVNAGELTAQTVALDTQSFQNSGVLQANATTGEALYLRALEGVVNYGSIIADGGALVFRDNVDNTDGEINYSGAGYVQFDGLNNQRGSLYSAGEVRLFGDTDNRSGLLQAVGEIRVSSSVLDNTAGIIKTDGSFEAQLETFDNRDGELLISGDDASISASGTIHNDKGQIVSSSLNLTAQHISGGTGTIYGANALLFDADTLSLSNTGSISAADTINITTKDLHNQGEISATTIMVDTDVTDNSQGEMLASEQLIIETGSLHNSKGKLSSQGSTSISLTAYLDGLSLDNQGGQIIASNLLNISADGGIDNSSDGIMQAEFIALSARELNNTNGTIASSQGLSIDVDGTLVNTAGLLQNDNGALILTATSVLNSTDGQILQANNGDLSITSGSLINSGVIDGGNASLHASETFTNSGYVQGTSVTVESGDIANSGQISGDDINVIAETLTNQQGVIAATGSGGIRIEGLAIDNTEGLIQSSTGSLYLDGQLNNDQGSVLLQGEGILTVGSLINNRFGEVTSGGNIYVLQDLNNDQGIVQASADLKMEQGTVSNVEGTLQAGNDLVLHTQRLNNSHGEIASGGEVSITAVTDIINGNGGTIVSESVTAIAGENIYNSAGQIESKGDVFLTASGNVDNVDGSVVSDAAIFLAAGDSVLNDQGVLASNQLGINAQTLSNIYGEILAVNSASIAAKTINNTQGQISAASVDASAGGSLVNVQGTITGTTVNLLTPHIENTAGTITAGGHNADALTVTSNVRINNEAGLIASNGDSFSLNVSDLNNQNGQILHYGTGSFDLSGSSTLNNSGLIAGAGNLDIHAPNLSNSGNIQAGGQLSLDGSLDNHSGASISAQNIAIDAHGAHVNNASVISAQNSLQIDAQSLTNEGKIFAQVQAWLSASEITHSGTLSSQAVSIENFNELISTGTIESKQTRISGNTLTIGADGLISSIGTGSHDLTLNISNLNNAGTLLNNARDMHISGSLDNSGRIVHAGAGTLALGTSGSISNSGGSIASAGTTTLESSVSGSGEIYARNGLQINTSGTFTNQSNLYTSGFLQIISALNNVGGNMISEGSLTIATSGNVTNTGLLQGQNLSLSAATLNNDNGTITSLGQADASINVFALTNNDGVIEAANTNFWLTTTGQTFNNTNGEISHEGAGRLTLASANNLLSNDGDITSNGTLVATANGTLSNRNGTVSASAVELNTTGALDNTFGSIKATGSASSSIESSQITNTNGNISANSASFSVTTGALNNTSGTIQLFGQGALRIDADSVQNTNLVAFIGSAGTLSLTADNEIYNTGIIGANGEFNISAALVTNHHKLISEAANIDIVNTGTLRNTGTISGSKGVVVDVTTLTNTGGEIQSNGNTDITSNTLAVGKINAQNVDINNKNNLIINDGETISASNDVTVHSDANITNKGSITANGTLLLTADKVTNSGTGRIKSQDETQIDTARLTNAGVIIGGSTVMLSGTSVSNMGSIAAGEYLDITANVTNSEFLFAGTNLTLNGNLTNTANVYSHQDMTLSGGQITNKGGMISAVQDLTIKGTLNNTYSGTFDYVDGETTTTKVYTVGRPNRAPTSYSDPTITWNTEYEENTTTMHSAKLSGKQGTIVSGRDMTLDGKITNNYSKIYAGRDLALKGSSLTNNNAQNKEVSEAVVVRESWESSCLQGSYEGNSYFCSEPGTAEKTGETIVDTYAEVTYVDGGNYGTILAGRNISGNLKEQLELVDATPESAYGSGFDTSASGSKGKGTKSKDIYKQSKDAVQVTRQTGDAQVTPSAERDASGEGLADIPQTDAGGQPGNHGYSTTTASAPSINASGAMIASESVAYRAKEALNAGTKDQPTVSRIEQPHYGENKQPTVETVSYNAVSIATGGQSPRSQRNAANDNHDVRLIRDSDSSNTVAMPGQTAQRPADFASQMNPKTGKPNALPDRKQEKGLVGNGTIASNSTHNPDLILKDQITNQEGNLAVARAQSQYNSNVANPFITAKQMQVLTDELNIDAYVIRDGQSNLFSAISQDDLLEDGVTLNAGGTIDIAASSITSDTGISGGEGLILRSEGALNIGSLGFLDSDKLLGLELGGDFTNTLDLESENVWLDVGGQFINNGNLTGTDTLTIAADKDIVNNTQLNGANIALDAGGDIINKTTFFQKTVNADNGDSLTYSWVDNVPQLNATESLTMNAGRNIDLLGTKLSVEGDITINAENDVLLGAVESVSGHEKYFKGGHDIVVDRTYDVVELDAGNNLSISAGNNLESEGAQFGAGKTASLSAGNEMNLDAVVASHYKADKKTKKSFLKKEVTETVSLHEQVQGSGINASNILINATVNEQGLITQNAKGDVTMTGANLEASENIVTYGNTINITAETYQDDEFTHTSKSSWGGLKSKSKEELAMDDLLSGSSLKAGQNVLINAGDNLNITASQIDARNVGLSAFNSVVITSGEESRLRETRSQSGGFLSGGNVYSSNESISGTLSTTADSSIINASENIIIDAGDATVIGSLLNADTGISVSTDIGDIQILAAKEKNQSYSHEKNVSVGLGDAISSLSRPDKLFSIDDGQFTATVATAQYDEVNHSSDSTRYKASQLNTEGTLTLDAISNITIEGSDLDAKGTVNLLANDDITIKEAVETYQESSDETHGSAEVNVVVQHQAVEVAKAAKAVDDANDQLSQAKADYRRYQKETNQLENTLAQLEADYAAGKAGITQADINEVESLLNDLKGDEQWYQAGIATATANLASKTTLLAQQTNAAANSGATYGFNAGVQLDIAANKISNSQQKSMSRGSNIDASNINVITGGDGQTGTTTISGSRLTAESGMNIYTDDLNIQASKNTQRSTSDSQSGNITIAQTVWGAAGGPTVSASLNVSEQQDKATTYTNSQLNADTLNIVTAGDTSIIGGNLDGRSSLFMDVGGDLNLESVQNRYSGSNKGMGISGGMGFEGVFTNESGANANSREAKTTVLGQAGDISSVNGGINATKGRYQTTETVLSSITGSNVDINVDGNTDITGALIAAIDADGNDNGQLNLSTGTISYSNLNNRSYSSNQSAGVNANVGVSEAADPADPNQSDTDLALNSSNYSYQNKSSQSLDKTLATFGEGNITVDGKEAELAGLNRSTENSANEIYNVDRQQGNIDLTVDHRLLNEKGRKEIAEEVENIADTVVLVKREIHSLGNQIDDKVELLFPGIEQYVDEQIKAGIDPREIQKQVNSESFKQAVESITPLAALAEEDPELLQETMAAAKVIDEGGVVVQDGLETIVIVGDKKLPLKTEVLDALGVVSNALGAIENTDSLIVAGMLAQGLKGLPGLIIGAGVDAAVGDDIDDLKRNATDEIAAWSTDKTKNEFGEDLAQEEIYQDSDFHTNIQAGAELVVDLSSSLLLSRVGGKGDANNAKNNSGENGNDSNLPDNYTQHSDGSISGPYGGKAVNSGYTTDDGSTIYQRQSEGGQGPYYTIVDGKQVPVSSPKDKTQIGEQYAHHKNEVNKQVEDLQAQGYSTQTDVRMFNDCGTTYCKPDVVYKNADGQIGFIEVKTGSGGLTTRQNEIFQKVGDNDYIMSPTRVLSKEAADAIGADYTPGMTVADAGYPKGIPIVIKRTAGVGE